MQQGAYLKLDRCPLCGVKRPLLGRVHVSLSMRPDKQVDLVWIVYKCSNCQGLVNACSKALINKYPWDYEEKSERYEEAISALSVDFYDPQPRTIPDEIPARVGDYLRQALESFHAPVGSIMLAASAVDAMLRHIGFVEGSLYRRIDQAKAGNVITEGMAEWAHQVRLDANAQRHADDVVDLPDTADAEQCFEFAVTLAEVLFVLPSRVRSGITRAKGKQTESSGGSRPS